MDKLPITDFMWNFYKEQGITFTDSEQATIIWNSDLPKSEILCALREIVSTTTDEALKAQIQRRLDTEAETERSFTENDDRYFFIFVPDDEEEWESCYFVSLDAAIAHGKGHSRENFKILKAPFSDKFGGCFADNDSRKIYVGGQAWYTKEGVLLDCECYTEEISISFSHPNPSCYEDAYIPLQSPFEIGDIVRMAGDSRPAIVQVSKEEWLRDLERNSSGVRKIPSSYDNTRLTVEFLEDGEMYHGHPYILLLEKIEQWGDELEWDLLQAASRLTKGEGMIDAFLYYYHMYRNRWKKE